MLLLLPYVVARSQAFRCRLFGSGMCLALVCKKQINFEVDPSFLFFSGKYPPKKKFLIFFLFAVVYLFGQFAAAREGQNCDRRSLAALLLPAPITHRAAQPPSLGLVRRKRFF